MEGREEKKLAMGHAKFGGSSQSSWLSRLNSTQVKLSESGKVSSQSAAGGSKLSMAIAIFFSSLHSKQVAALSAALSHWCTSKLA